MIRALRPCSPRVEVRRKWSFWPSFLKGPPSRASGLFSSVYQSKSPSAFCGFIASSAGWTESARYTQSRACSSLSITLRLSSWTTFMDSFSCWAMALRSTLTANDTNPSDQDARYLQVPKTYCQWMHWIDLYPRHWMYCAVGQHFGCFPRRSWQRGVMWFTIKTEWSITYNFKQPICHSTTVTVTRVYFEYLHQWLTTDVSNSYHILKSDSSSLFNIWHIIFYSLVWFWFPWRETTRAPWPPNQDSDKQFYVPQDMRYIHSSFAFTCFDYSFTICYYAYFMSRHKGLWAPDSIRPLTADHQFCTSLTLYNQLSSLIQTDAQTSASRNIIP